MLDLLMWPLYLVFIVSATILPTALIFGITMPFVGVLVRYRAEYTPIRGVGLPGEDGGDLRSETYSYFGMMKRVHRVQGWPGLYKGIMPSIIATLFTILVISPVAMFLAIGHQVLPSGRMVLPAQSSIVLLILNFGLSLVPAILLIPMQIITNRTITTPHKLSAFAPKAALQVLLSPAERASPLRLYAVPGVALSEILQALVAPFLSMLLQFVPGIYLSHRLPVLLAALPIIALATALLTPLQVLGTRLTLQRLDDKAPDAAADAAPPAYEEVVELRTAEHAPYTSLLDCGRQVVREEGWRTLFRAWWVTPLTILLSTGMAMAQ
ncbi:mitochondrial carrier [Mycena olivaceomarginata]|nr:mitochondrial carrier [Mycena olivaceomarginata]